MLTHGHLTIYTYLQKQVKKQPDKSFLIYKDKDISYYEMLKRANKTAHFLHSVGVEKGDKVAVMLQNSPNFYDFWFGCAALGAVLLPINTASTARELEYFLDHSDSKVFLYEKDLVSLEHLNVADSMDLNARKTLNHWESYMNQFDDTNLNREVSPHDVCGMMYTSGTTSKPKGVLVTHENYLYAGHSAVVYQQLTSEDRYLIFLPLFHVNSQYYTSMAMLVVGGTIVLLEKFQASSFWEEVERYKPTVSSFVATIIKILLELPYHSSEKNHTIRQIGYGLFVTKEEIEQFKKRFDINIFQWYGMTESITTNVVTPLYEEMPTDPNTNILAIGKPGLGQEVKIVDENLNELPPYQTGQIIVKSPSLMKGYYKNEKATKETLVGGWLYTGDSGYYNEEGFIWFVDRDKDVIKRAGENISSIEIENVISNYPAVKDCAVIGIPDHLREEAIVAYISTENTEDKEDLNELLNEFCKKQLSYFKVPQQFISVDEFPRTSIGKIQKNVLREQYFEEKDKN